MNEEELQTVVDKAVREAFEPFDGLHMGWFTPDELDLVLEALTYYELILQGKDDDTAEQVACLLEAMIELKEEGGVK